MPYVRPNAYTNATPISAQAIRENHEALRKYVDAGVVAADIASGSVGHEQMQRGEFASVAPDHRFATGNHYSGFTDSDPTRMAVIGLTLKAGPDVSLWHPVIGKRFRVESTDALALVSVYCSMFPRKNLVSPASGKSENLWLFLDGVQIAGTRCRYFSDADSTVSSEANGGGASRLREATVTMLLQGLAAGWHTIVARVDPNADFAQIFPRSIHAEAFEV